MHVFLEAQRQRLYLTQILYAGGSEESKRRERGSARRYISMQKKGETEKVTLLISWCYFKRGVMLLCTGKRKYFKRDSSLIFIFIISNIYSASCRTDFFLQWNPKEDIL